LNVSKRITEISKKSAKDEKAKCKMDQEIRKMEEAAMKAYMNDITLGRDLTTSSYLNENLENAETSSTSQEYKQQIEQQIQELRPKPIDPFLNQRDIQEIEEEKAAAYAAAAAIAKKKKKAEESGKKFDDGPSMWVEAVSEDGHTYYWNIKTNGNIGRNNNQ